MGTNPVSLSIDLEWDMTRREFEGHMSTYILSPSLLVGISRTFLFIFFFFCHSPSFISVWCMRSSQSLCKLIHWALVFREWNECDGGVSDHLWGEVKVRIRWRRTKSRQWVMNLWRIYLSTEEMRLPYLLSSVWEEDEREMEECEGCRDGPWLISAEERGGWRLVW